MLMIKARPLSRLLLFGLCFSLAENSLANSGPAQSFISAHADSSIAAAANPAGLARLERPELLGQVLYFSSESTFRTDDDSFRPNRSSESDGSMAVPSLFYARPFSDQLVFGTSVTVPGGFGEDFDDDAPSRYLVDEWATGYVSIAPALAYRVNEKLSWAAGITANYSVLTYESAVFNGAGSSDGRMELEADAWAFGFQLGLLYEMSTKTRFGVGYRSKIEPELDDKPDFSNLSASRRTQLDNAGVLDQSIEIDMAFPAIMTAGVWHEFDSGLELAWDLIWIDFSEFGLSQITVGETSIERDSEQFQDGYGSSVGVAYPVNDKWRIKAGALYLSEMTDEDRTFMLRLDRIWGVGAGVEYTFNNRWIAGVNLNYYDLGEAPTEQNIPVLGTVAGEYTDNKAIGIDFTLRWMR